MVLQFEVYLQTNYILGKEKIDILNEVKYFARHVNNLSNFIDGHKVSIESDWNIQSSSSLVVRGVTSQYEYNLSFGQGIKSSFILSNGGFYVMELKEKIIGNFPEGIICGEINVAPNFIDLNLSRDIYC